MNFEVHDIPSRYRHPEHDQFQACLATIDFAGRFDALCAAHPRRGLDVPVAIRHSALQDTGRRWFYDRRWKYWGFREKERYPQHCGLGLDVRIDARVEMALLFATPRGHFSGAFPRISRDLRRVTEPDFVYRPANPAPRIATVEELPVILGECMALYDVVADALRAAEWWRPEFGCVA